MLPERCSQLDRPRSTATPAWAPSVPSSMAVELTSGALEGAHLQGPICLSYPILPPPGFGAIQNSLNTPALPGTPPPGRQPPLLLLECPLAFQDSDLQTQSITFPNPPTPDLSQEASSSPEMFSWTPSLEPDPVTLCLPHPCTHLLSRTPGKASCGRADLSGPRPPVSTSA
jgi:hypothetical protein